MNAAEEFVDDFLTHVGVKGMKWGVRKAPSARGLSTTVKPSRFRKTKVKVKGGRAHPAVPEAISAREKQRILKKSGVNALSNKDLQELQTRLNLEQNVSRMSKGRVNSGKQWAEEELKKAGSARLKARRAVKGAAKVAAVAAT
jgi:hypothetical protein